MTNLFLCYGVAGDKSPWTTRGADTWRAAFGRLWRLVSYTLFSRDDAE